MRRHLGILLLAVGLVIMAWPVVTWAYGLYWQERLASELPRINTARIQELDLRRGALPRTVPSVKVKAKKKPKAAKVPATVARGSQKAKTAGATLNALALKPSKTLLRARPVSKGGPVARLWIQRINLDALVVEGDDRFALRRGPGHLPRTGLPGENRNCAIAAHRDGWFQRLHDVHEGDPIWLETRDSLFKYTVSLKKVVTPNRGDLLNQGKRPVLTLITCTGPGYPRSKYRLLVFCRLSGTYPRDSEAAE